VYGTTFFNVPVARQVIGFLYLTFVPGIILIRLLKIDKLDTTETILLSAGLSIASLMLIGLATSESYSLIGISQPLSPTPMLIILNSFILVGAALSCLRNNDIELPTVEDHKLFPVSILLIGLPILSVAGAFWTNTTGNSSILLFMILVAAVIFALSILSKRFISPKLYTLTIFSVAIALLFHSSLISNYIYGTDIQMEYYTFKATQKNAYWNSTAYTDPRFGRFNTMLSITILPTIYSNILNMDGTWILKIVFPLIFSFVPLGLYKMWQTNLGRKTAFISVFFLMSQMAFYTEMLGLTRQMTAELFFVLLFLVILNEKLDSISNKVFFIIFSIALVVSHYAMSIIFFFLISVVWLYMFLIKRKCKNLTLSLVLSFFVIMFSWYIFTSASASFDSMLSFGDYVYSQLGQFFNPASRGTMVLRALGMERPASIWNLVSRAFAYFTEFLIFVGFVGLITRRIKMHADREYIMFSYLAMTILVMTILIPSFAETLNINRFYHILLFFLAPLCILGAEVLVKFAFKRETEFKVSILLLIVLVPYFLFQTGFIYQVVGSETWSVPLGKDRMDKFTLYIDYGYVDEQSVFGAQWMSKNIDIKHTQIYADAVSRHKVLLSYGMIHEDFVEVLSNTTVVATNGTLYLSQLNVVYGKIVGERFFHIWNYSELSSLLDDLSKIYSNDGSEIYRNMATMPGT